MRIAYYAHVNGGYESGVIPKIGGQVGQWRGAGHEVRAFVLTRDEPAPFRARLGDARIERYGGPLSRLAAVTRLVRAVRRFRPDLVYARWDLFYPPMMWFPGPTLVVEINTDDVSEYGLSSRRRSLYNARTRGLLLGRAAALVCVTAELSLRPSFQRFPGRRAVISNAVDLAAYPVLPAPANPGPRLVFVGTANQPWHGVDKLEVLASLRPDWRIGVVGMTRPARDVPPNIEWHGAVDRAGTIALLARADVGVGTLALHRKSMSEACPLKVREYLAVGLPVIYGYDDPDADRLEPYVLRISNTESNVVDELGRIDAFVKRSSGVRVPRSLIAHIDVPSKERQRLALFDELARA